MSPLPGAKGAKTPRSEARSPAAKRELPAKLRSTTSEHLKDSLSKVHDLDSLAIQRIVAAGLLLRVRDLLLRDLDRVLTEFGTSLARFQVLAIICHDGGGLQLSEIASQAAVHPTTLTSTIDRLVRDGLIQRKSDPKDRRGILALGTPKGYQLYHKARTELAAIEYGLAEVDLGTIEKLLVSLDKIAGVIEEPLAARQARLQAAAPAPPSRARKVPVRSA